MIYLISYSTKNAQTSNFTQTFEKSCIEVIIEVFRMKGLTKEKGKIEISQVIWYFVEGYPTLF
jgi:hypothetical protein